MKITESSTPHTHAQPAHFKTFNPFSETSQQYQKMLEDLIEEYCELLPIDEPEDYVHIIFNCLKCRRALADRPDVKEAYDFFWKAQFGSEEKAEAYRQQVVSDQMESYSAFLYSQGVNTTGWDRDQLEEALFEDEEMSQRYSQHQINGAWELIQQGGKEAGQKS